ncbi:MAG: isoaspartyl peptidase/L-asparaginase [Deltaproteobacteria bacterium]|nr:isoaspartyl peptidase/L-asparaginase [Deltaproteobacteria bacterium]
MRALVVHGGAGTAPVAGEAQELACGRALDLGWKVLAGGGSALDAVVRAVEHMEDAPTLNAGYGACLSEDGTVELDAAVMEGTTRRAGAVALVRRLRHPVRVARLLLEEGRHVFLAGAAAETFAAAQGVALIDPESLVTPERRAAWEARRRDPASGGTRFTSDGGAGTVGAVALDAAGHVAAATSTGGISGKRAGRIGDSPVIGAGTLADDGAGAASATGDGEAIMRVTLASAAIERVRSGMAPERAATLALAELTRVGARGGIILVDRFGRTAGVYTTAYMTWCRRSG